MEWIMIKVRVGQETFCKWGRSSLRFISGPIFLGDIPRLQSAQSTQSAELLLSWPEGLVRLRSLGCRNPPRLPCKWGHKGALAFSLETLPAC